MKISKIDVFIRISLCDITLLSIGNRNSHSRVKNKWTKDKIYEFVYLGSLMTPTNDVSLEIQRRMQIGASSDCANICSRATFHARPNSSFTRPWSAWVLTKREKNQLLAFERKVARTICGLKIENGVYRRRYNHELDKEFDSPNALNVTKTSRLRCAGHMIRIPEDITLRENVNFTDFHLHYKLRRIVQVWPRIKKKIFWRFSNHRRPSILFWPKDRN
jgi:hypothetical protein